MSMTIGKKDTRCFVIQLVVYKHSITGKRKLKKFELVCPKCRNGILPFGKKQKDILKVECPVCQESFKDIFEEVEENSL